MSAQPTQMGSAMSFIRVSRPATAFSDSPHSDPSGTASTSTLAVKHNTQEGKSRVRIPVPARSFYWQCMPIGDSPIHAVCSLVTGMSLSACRAGIRLELYAIHTPMDRLIDIAAKHAMNCK